MERITTPMLAVNTLPREAVEITITIGANGIEESLKFYLNRALMVTRRRQLLDNMLCTPKWRRYQLCSHEFQNKNSTEVEKRGYLYELKNIKMPR